MDSQRRFEGPDLESLLAQVQRELGNEATILEANKLRTGGVGGFFTRERFEVIASVPESASAPAAPAAPSPAEALDAALRSATTAPRRITTTPKIWSGPGAGTTSDTTEAARATSHLEDAVMAAIAAADAQADEVTAPNRATSILELAEQRNAEERNLSTDHAPEPAPAPTVSTEGPAFAEVLGKLAREALRDQQPESEAEAFVPLTEEAATITTQPKEPAPPAIVMPAPTSVPVSTPAPAPALAVEPPAIRNVTPAPRPAPPSPVAAALACLGVPEHLLPATHARSEIRSDLVAALRWLPTADPLPQSSGSVIAVVGNADQAMATAQQLARELGCDEHEIIVANEAADDATPTWMQLRHLEEAIERRRSWRRRNAPTVVAVAAPLGYDPAVWARPMLDALEPTIAWGVVSADRKAEDVQAWIDRLGGVDAIALTDTALTVSPATMLQLGIPIARLDGDRADPMTWANLLLARLAA